MAKDKGSKKSRSGDRSAAMSPDDADLWRRVADTAEPLLKGKIEDMLEKKNLLKT